MLPDNIYIGTSGWSYAGWREPFYENERQENWLNFYACRFNTVEINSTFYRLQKTTTFQSWADKTPANFRFSLKANRYLTHNKKLLDPSLSISVEKERCKPLAEKLSVMLWQLPANFSCNHDRLEAFVESLAQWHRVRHVIEFRHDSWFTSETASLLNTYHIAVCQSDAADWPLWSEVTTDLVYVRLHGHTDTYVSKYNKNSLNAWAHKILQWHEQEKQVYVYFDNDAQAAAPKNAIELQKIVENLALNHRHTASEISL